MFNFGVCKVSAEMLWQIFKIRQRKDVFSSVPKLSQLLWWKSSSISLLWLTDLVENGCRILFQGCAFFCLHDKAPEFSQDAAFQKAICMCLGLAVPNLCIFYLCWECCGTWPVNGFKCERVPVWVCSHPEARSRLLPRAGTRCSSQGHGKAALVWRVGWVQRAGDGAWLEGGVWRWAGRMVKEACGAIKASTGVRGLDQGTRAGSRAGTEGALEKKVRKLEGFCWVWLLKDCHSSAASNWLGSWWWNAYPGDEVYKQLCMKYWISWSCRGVCWYWNLRLVPHCTMWENIGKERLNLSSKSGKQGVYLSKFWMFVLPSQQLSHKLGNLTVC